MSKLEFMFTRDLDIKYYIFNSYVRMNSIRKAFFNTNLDKLEDYCVMINVHADGPLGTYIIHKFYEGVLLGTDDFDTAFFIKEYNEIRKNESTLIEVDLLKIDLNDPKWSKHTFTKKSLYNEEDLNKKTLWTIVLDENDKAVALISAHDSRRCFNDERKCSFLRVNTIDDGLDYLKTFCIDNNR